MANKSIIKQLQEELSPSGDVNQLGGLSLDTSLISQPQGTTTFVLNGVNETSEGDLGFLAREESNAPSFDLTATGQLEPGYIPIGKVYIGNEESLILLAHSNGNSAIIIVDRQDNVFLQVSDRYQTSKLGFKVSQQIDITFRLRRGCERTIYWVDPKPRIYVIERPEKFKNETTGEWEIAKFSLFRTYSKIPEVTSLVVLDGVGSLPPGSYNFSPQYLDEDFNPTEFITSTETVNVYNSLLTDAYKDIRGATKETNSSYLQFTNTNKAIKIEVDPLSLDTNFPFYRWAITEANAGSGIISDTKYSEVLSTSDNTFIYTGLNFESSGTQAEITLFNNIIEKADSIEQVENRLLLANVKGKEIDYCKLQKYASRITSDMILKQVVLTEVEANNAKNPSVHHQGTGNMPGEIYSYAITYILDDNTVLPAFHIPGRSPAVSPTTRYTSGPEVYPMASNNACEDTRYTDNSTCSSGNMWGVDSEGVALTDLPVRHHRFPLRTDHNIPFIEKVTGDRVTNYVKRIQVSISGDTTFDLPISCEDETSPIYDPACVTTYVPPFSLDVGYVKDTIAETYTTIIDPVKWALSLGEAQGTVTDTRISSTLMGAVITLDTAEFYEVSETGAKTLLTGTTVGGVFTSARSAKGIVYTISLIEADEEFQEDVYVSSLFGIRFSNIEIPSEADLNGNKVIGYYIVRNERKESDRTIVDSAVLTSTLINKNFVGSGLLFPETLAQPVSTLKTDILTMINPEFKFNNVNYTNFSRITKQGNFNKVEAIRSRVKINDVADGTGYVAGKHKDGEKDEDGFSLHIKTRDNLTEFVPSTSFVLDDTDIKQVFYLPALGNKVIPDSTDTPVDVFNLASDNKTGIISLAAPFTEPILTSLPYVYLHRDNLNPYSTFRLEPYYKESVNPVYFNGTSPSSTDIWNGDSYISSMRYVNSIFYAIRMKQRKGKTSAWSYILSAVLIVGALALTIFSFGAGAPILATTVAASLAGVGTALALSGIKQDAWNKAYNQLYAEGLRETITDDYILNDKDPNTLQERGFKKNPQDDEIQWLGECANIWFESSVNVSLRHGATDNTPDFLNAPGNRELGCTYPETNHEYFGINSVGSGAEDITPTTSLDAHMLKKLTVLDASRKSNKSYVGVAAAEMYLLNPDYTRRNKQKAYNHLGIEYDCCSDCNETFPHRWHWSEQAFQEELTDNFRVFLPNNYRDLEGETGAITDIFRIQNNVYIHTEEALWLCPQNIQERTTDNIVSFIGAGEYFNIPPRKIVDDSNSSAGNIHKWGRLKSKNGVLFPSYKEKKWYLFNGESLQPLSDSGLSAYFKNNMSFDILNSYYTSNLTNYPYRNNPSNLLGVGFISSYDTNKERFLMTKKDQVITNLPVNTKYQLCNEGGLTTIFNNIDQTIAEQAELGWSYLGIEDCKLKFSKMGTKLLTTTREETVTLSNTTVVHAFYDTSGSFGGVEPGGQLDQIKQSVIAWYVSFRPDDILDVNGESALLKHHYDSTERWLNYPATIPAGGEVLVLTFVNEANPSYSSATLGATIPSPTNPYYVQDYTAFVNTVYPSFLSFKGINYPIMTSGVAATTGIAFLQHSLAAIKGRDFTLDEVNALEVNSAYSPAVWSTLKSSLLDNPYATLVDGVGEPGLEKYNWQIKSNKNDLGTAATPTCPASTDIISPCQFAEDINALLVGSTTTETVEVTIEVPVVLYQYIEGENFVPQVVDHSHTISYSLKNRQWVSWHSYLPSFYLHVQEKFYSWKQGMGYIYKHNVKGSYGNFYGEASPFIVEYVDNSNPLSNKIWEDFTFHTEAKTFDAETQEYLDQRDITFNKLLVYNSYQISGELEMVLKNNNAPSYLFDQIKNKVNLGQITLDRNERNWSVNNLRDMRVNTSETMFNKNIANLQNSYYIDKIVNPDAIDFNKSWTEQESFRDKYLVVRLIFDTFANTRLIFNYSTFSKNVSER